MTKTKRKLFFQLLLLFLFETIFVIVGYFMDLFNLVIVIAIIVMNLVTLPVLFFSLNKRQ